MKSNLITIYKVGSEIICLANEFRVEDNCITFAQNFKLESVRIKETPINILNNIHNKFIIRIDSHKTFHFVPYSGLSEFLESIEQAKGDMDTNYLLYISPDILKSKYNKAIKQIDEYIYNSYIITQKKGKCLLQDDYINVFTEGLKYKKIKNKRKYFFIDELNNLEKTNDLIDEFKTELNTKIYNRICDKISKIKNEKYLKLKTNLSQHNTSILMQSENIHNFKISLTENGADWYYNDEEKYCNKNQITIFVREKYEQKLLKGGSKYINGDFVDFKKETIDEWQKIIEEISNDENKMTSFYDGFSDYDKKSFKYNLSRKYDCILEPIKLITSRYINNFDGIPYYYKYEKLYAAVERSDYYSDEKYAVHPKYNLYLFVNDNIIDIVSTKPHTANYTVRIMKNKEELAIFFLMRYFSSFIENKRENISKYNNFLLNKFGIECFYKS